VIEVEFLDVIKTRRSIRKYKPNPISDKDIEYVLNAARLAPSWKNQQSWKYVVVKDKEKIKKIASARPQSQDWLSEAPVMIVACANPDDSGHREGKDYYLVDIGISLEHLLLAARDRGLGTCWIGGFDEKTVKDAIEAPENVRIVAYTPLGNPDEKKDEIIDRKPLNEVCFSEKYGKKLM
jgi:nitroreductase